MSAGITIEALAEQRQDLFARQRELARRGAVMAQSMLQEMFAATPLLEKVEITFEYDWRERRGQPYRRCLPMARITFTAPIAPVEMLTSYESEVRADSPMDADDMALQFQLHLEDRGVLKRMGELLDAGDSASFISRSRSSDQPAAGFNPVLLGEFAEVL
ncbi:MAG: hypothetical protein EKK53_23485 [Burkholderiales bacterium]|nr:MAG: hypothetical protein EKK53_23485 [Burkholderiales bacterium]